MNPPFPFVPSDFFVFRTPTLPFEFLDSWCHAGSGGPLETRRQQLRTLLREALHRPEIRDALFLASPDLEAMLDPWLLDGLEAGKRDRIDRSLVRYLSRMASRPTPFGLFAGCSLGTWGDATRLATQAWSGSVRHTRLDMDYLCGLVEALEKDPAVRQVLLYRPNTSLYPAAGRWRYAEGRVHPERGRNYYLVALEDTPTLASTLKRAQGGASIKALAAPLALAGITLEEAMAFIHELIDNQVLVSDLYPAVTGPEPIHGIVGRLRSDPRTAPFADQLESARESLQAMDEQGLGQAPCGYRKLAKQLECLPARLNLKHLFQVDLVKPAPEARLNRKVQAAIVEAVALHWRLTPPSTQDPMQDFKKAFLARYEEQWVPLLEALDPETGIGFGGAHAITAQAAPLLEGLTFPSAGAREPLFSKRSAFILKRLLELGPAPEWELTDADLHALQNPKPNPVPDTFSTMASVAAASPEAVDDGEFKLLLEAYSGPSGARLLGRFCHADPELAQRVRAHLHRESELMPEAVFAEVVHHPEGRIGNIICRPLLRPYEIPYLGVSGAHESFQIPLQDLQVAVQGDRVALRSQRLGKRIIPRLTSAHNYTHGLDVYRFLCSLQDQGAASGGWSWGPLDELPYLPRVVRGRHILQKARWLVRQEEINGFVSAAGDDAFKRFSELRARRGFPRMVVLVDGDNELLVDLDQPLWLETLLHLVARRPSFQLQEFFPGAGELVAQAPEGRFCHQLIVPFTRPHPAQAPAADHQRQAPHRVERVFLPGSEWLSLKIYTGSSTADQVLLQALPILLEETAGLWDRWFFIRYSDPDHHLRLRFHGGPELNATLLPLLHRMAPLQSAGWIWKLQTDTYQRELERYGGEPGILLAEELFTHDSRAVLELMNAYPGDDGAQWRWRMGLKAVDALLDDLGFDLAAKARIIQDARAGLGREFRSNEGLDVQLGAKFRPQRKELEAFLFQAQAENAAQPGLAILAARSRNWARCLEALGKSELDGSLLRPRSELATSYTHMHLNRLLPAAQRAQEFVLYDFLDRLYQSRLARRRNLGT